MMDTGLAIFQDKTIRRTWHKEEWWFVVEDVVAALTDSQDAKQYVKRMRERDEELNKGWVQLVPTLPVPTAGGLQRMSCSNTEGLFRIIQSIPSKRAEPFKLWLAKVGYDRIKEIENPELAQDRAKFYYERKGYPASWIEKRLRGVAIRQELVDEWKARGVEHSKDFAILTDEISKATFDKTVSEYRQLKGLERTDQNLRDHMTDWEIILTMVGEKATTDIARERDAQGLGENQEAAQEGGSIARNTRHDLERKLRRPIVSSKNADDITGKRRLGKK